MSLPHGGTAPQTWEWCALGEVASVVRGVTFKKGDAVAIQGPGLVPVLRHTNVWGALRLDDLIYLPAGQVKPSQILRAGDIVMTSSGSREHLARTSLIPHGGEFAFGAFCMAVKPGDAIDGAFLRRYLEHAAVKRALVDSAGGTTLVNLTKGQVEALLVPVPPMNEQREVVVAIDVACARIDALEAEVAGVERLSRSLFRSALREAFTASVPQESVRPLGDVVTVKAGAGFPKERQGRSVGPLPFAKVAEISDAVRTNAGRVVGARNYIELAEAKELRAPILPVGTVVMAKIGEAVRNERRGILGVEATVDNNVMAWIPSEQLIPEYLYFWSQSIALASLANATAVPSIRKSDVVALEIPVPGLAEQAAVIGSLEALRSLSASLEDQVAALRRHLRAIRMSVLHAAFCGLLAVEATDG